MSGPGPLQTVQTAEFRGGGISGWKKVDGVRSIGLSLDQYSQITPLSAVKDGDLISLTQHMIQALDSVWVSNVKGDG